MQQPSVVPPKRVFPSALKMDEEARRRSEAATQQLMQNYSGQPNVGIRLMSKMGYGIAGESSVESAPIFCCRLLFARGFVQLEQL